MEWTDIKQTVKSGCEDDGRAIVMPETDDHNTQPAAPERAPARRSSHDDRPVLHLGHSPDPDDAFMWFPITGIGGASQPLLDTGRFRFEAVQQDIQTLNDRSNTGDLEITAISIAQYPYIADRYALTSCGSSMGDGYGPKLVARKPHAPEWLQDPRVRIAVPGLRTSALLATLLMLGVRKLNVFPIDFAQVIDRVANGEFDAGLVIHEGQLTYQNAGLYLIADLGAWWTSQTHLPLPLGGNVIRRDLETLHGPGTLREVTATLLRSIRYAMEHRDQAIDYALNYARGMDRNLAERFVQMYVNKHTLDFGPEGREGVRRFLTRASSAGLTPHLGEVDFIEPV